MVPMRYVSIQEVLFTLATSRGRGHLLQSMFLQKMCVLYPVSMKGGKLDPCRHGVMEVEEDVCVCVCVYIFIKLHITAQSGPVILVILCHSHG